MVLTLFNDEYGCGNCGRRFRVPSFSEFSYGEFLLRSEGTTEQLYLQGLDNSVFDELGDFTDHNPRLAKIDANTRADLFQEAFGELAIDPNDQGAHWSLGRFPTCPDCGEAKWGWRREINEAITVELAEPTYSLWNGYATNEKKLRVDQFLKRKGYRRFLVF